MSYRYSIAHGGSLTEVYCLDNARTFALEYLSGTGGLPVHVLDKETGRGGFIVHHYKALAGNKPYEGTVALDNGDLLLTTYSDEPGTFYMQNTIWLRST